MATTTPTKDVKELTVEERLEALYKLQTILSEIDRIRTLRGELPLEVQDLEDEVEGLTTRINNFKEDIARCNDSLKHQATAIEQANAMIAKYEADQNDVRNNREFDFLTKEIEFQKLNIELAEKKIGEAKRQIDYVNTNIAASQEQLDERRHLLDEKKSELDEIINETRQDEEKSREKAKRIEKKLAEADPRLLNAFKRIRKNARNGLGVVYVQRDACGGCFNRIPPQRQMEIKMRKKIIVCEYCGRILIDPAIAGIKEEVKKEVKKESKRSRKTKE